MKTIYVILGSTRQGRNGEKVFHWVKEYVASLTDKRVRFEYVDLKDWQIPFVEHFMPPMTGQYPEGIVSKWAKYIGKADGFLIVTPEYNHGYPAVLKNALDVLYKEWNGKHVAFVSYGAHSGGIRAVEQLRQVVIELRMIPLKDEVNVPFVWDAFSEDGTIKNAHLYSLLESSVDGLVTCVLGK